MTRAMTLARKVLSAVCSFASGAVVGFVVGFYAPVVVALIRGEDPIHRGHYFDWIEISIVVGPILIGGIFAALAWYQRLRRLRMAVHCFALIYACWQLWLMTS